MERLALLTSHLHASANHIQWIANCGRERRKGCECVCACVSEMERVMVRMMVRVRVKIRVMGRVRVRESKG